MTLLASPKFEAQDLPDFIDPEIVARLGSGTMFLSEFTRPLAVVPNNRIDELYEHGAHNLWRSLTELLAPDIALQIIFDDEQNVRLVPVAAQRWDE